MTSGVPANLSYSMALCSLLESEPVANYNRQTLSCPASIPPSGEMHSLWKEKDLANIFNFHPSL